MKSKKTIDALVEEDKTNVMTWHGRTEKEPRDFLSWLEILEHFDQSTTLTTTSVGLQDSEASWKPLVKGTSLFMYGYFEKTEMPSHSELSEGSVETEESDEQKSAFSFHTTQPVQARENGLVIIF